MKFWTKMTLNGLQSFAICFALSSKLSFIRFEFDQWKNSISQAMIMNLKVKFPFRIKFG